MHAHDLQASRNNFLEGREKGIGLEDSGRIPAEHALQFLRKLDEEVDEACWKTFSKL